MKKIFLFLIFIFGLFYISCSASIEDPIEKVEVPQQLQNYNEIYKDVNTLSDYGFYYNDYVTKSVVFRASFYSSFPEPLSNNNKGQGKVMHFFKSNYQYTLFNEFLEHFDELFGFGLVNYLEKDNIINCIGVNDDVINENVLYDFLLLVDKDQNLYLIDQAIKKDFSFSIVLIHEVVLLEAVKEVQFASAIINSDYEKITINEFKLLIDQFNNDFDFSKIEDKLAHKLTFFNGKYHLWYRLEDDFILSIYTDNVYDNVVFELIFFRDGVATFVSKSITNFEKFIYDENLGKYFGLYQGLNEDFLEVGIDQNGIYMGLSVEMKSGFRRKESGYFYLDNNYLVLDQSTEYLISKLYFEIIESDEAIILKYNDNLSSDPYRPNSHDDSCKIPVDYQFEMKK